MNDGIAMANPEAVSVTTSTATAAATPAPHVPLALMENLSARFRPGGLCLMLLGSDGTLLHRDGAAGTFFQRFVVPMIQNPEVAGANLAEGLGATLNAAAPVSVWEGLPGVAMALFPFVERRQRIGTLVLAGKAMSFKLGEDVVRACNRLGLDAIWLGQQADELPAYTEEAIQRQGRLLLTMVRDQLRLGGLEHELTSLSSQLANTYEELSLIYQISGGMRVNRRPADFFKQACIDAIEVMGMRAMGVALATSEKLGLEPVIYGSVTLARSTITRLAGDLVTCMKARGTPLLINDLAKDRKFGWFAAEGASRLLAVPMQRGEEVLGVLFGIDKEIGEFDSVDSKLLNSIANESAIYLENALLFEDVHGLMMGLLHSLTSAVDAKDAYTCGHSERVAVLSKIIAQEAGLSEQQVERIYMAGILHDVGKIGVPESVLQKPGRLTAEEFEQMKKHPAIGARILADVKQIQDIIPGVMHHHERYDGKGYPDGLSGQNIPLMGRIICLADCFDAMTSTRTYRKALPLEVTLADIRRCSGTQFDPGLTEAFFRIGMDRLREVMRHQSGNRLDVRATAPVAAEQPPAQSAAATTTPTPAAREKAA
jgi:HD-GYP domain-containing protein (c-di-GMP phosphodiesterase class II)